MSTSKLTRIVTTAALVASIEFPALALAQSKPENSEGAEVEEE